MATIYNYDPKYHNMFIYDREPGDLRERFSPSLGAGGTVVPGQGGTLDLQLFPIRRNTSFNGGSFDLSGVNYTLARPFAEGVFWRAREIWAEDGSRLSEFSTTSTLDDLFRFPFGWSGMNLMISQYPFGFLLSRKHMLVPTKLLSLWYGDPRESGPEGGTPSAISRLMYDHPEIPYGSDGTVADKVFFMGNDGVTHEMRVTDSNPEDNIVVGVHRIEKNGSYESSDWSVIVFDSELPIDYKVYNNIIASDLPDGTQVMIVFDNGKAMRAVYDGGGFDNFLRNIRTSSVMLQDFDDTISFRDEGLIFVQHKILGTCIYYKTLSGLEFTVFDSNENIEDLEGSGYSRLSQFKAFFDNIEGIPGIPQLTFWDSASQNAAFIKKSPTYGQSQTYTPPGKNPIYPITVGVTATNVEDISIYKFSENSVTGDGSGFEYQTPSPVSFEFFPPTAQEKTPTDQRDQNTEDQLKIYAYGSSGPIEQIRDDIPIGSVYSNAMLQIGLDFLPYKRFPSPADFVDFKYRTDIYVDGQLHDSFAGRSDQLRTEPLGEEGILTRDMPYVPRSFITGRFSGVTADGGFGGIFTTRPTYYFDHKWIKNFAHEQAGKTLSTRFRCNFVDGSTYDSGILDILQIQPEILSVPTFDSFIPEIVDDGEGPPMGSIGIPFFVGGLPETEDVTFGLNGFSASPNIFAGDETSEVERGSLCKFYVSKFRGAGEFTFAFLGEKYVTHDDISNGFVFSVPNQTIFPDGSDPESLVGTELWVVYELDHPAYVLDTNKLFRPDETPLNDFVDSNAIVSPPYFLFEIP
jgi:hypothetical protein